MSLVDLWRKTHTIGATAVVMLLTLTSCQHAKDDQTPQAPQIPFERYVLDNGLTVILHEDHSDPARLLKTKNSKITIIAPMDARSS